MITRCFAFGCSITDWTWATCADFIGINFDEYYNLGKPGASNTFMMNRLVEADNLFKFNSSDTIVIGMTGFGRFSYYDGNSGWQTHGDILSLPGTTKHNNHVDIFNPEWAVYNSYIAMKIIKEYLTFRGIPHYIYAAVDYKHWITDYDLYNLKKEDSIKVLEIEKLLDVTEALFESTGELRREHKSYPIKFEDGELEMHPTPEEHFVYFSNHFPQFNSLKSKELLIYLKNNFDYSSKSNQFVKFKKIFPHKRSVSSRLFIES
jgi:hypothetical protein